MAHSSRDQWERSTTCHHEVLCQATSWLTLGRPGLSLPPPWRHFIQCHAGPQYLLRKLLIIHIIMLEKGEDSHYRFSSTQGCHLPSCFGMLHLVTPVQKKFCLQVFFAEFLNWKRINFDSRIPFNKKLTLTDCWAEQYNNKKRLWGRKQKQNKSKATLLFAPSQGWQGELRARGKCLWPRVSPSATTTWWSAARRCRG